MRGGGATELNETQKWATRKKRLRTTGLDEMWEPRLLTTYGHSRPVTGKVLPFYV
jgi:hypothetical protein